MACHNDRTGTAGLRSEEKDEGRDQHRRAEVIWCA
jgi:hypothetical protein